VEDLLRNITPLAKLPLLSAVAEMVLPMWTLETANPLIRKIAPIAQRHGFSVALYGSVLDASESNKDLDLFFVEQDAEICDVQSCLHEIGTLSEVRTTGNAFQCGGDACAVIWLRDGSVIDAQFRSTGSVYASCAPI